MTKKFAYVGSYTSPAMNGQGNGINVFEIEPVSNNWTHVQPVKAVADPSFLALDREGRCLYCVSESQDTVNAFSIDADTGHLTFLNSQPTGSSTPASLSLDSTGCYVIVGNYFGGSVAVFPVEQEGRLGSIIQLISLEGEPGPNQAEQSSSHPHDIVFDPNGRYLIVPDKGFDKIFSFKQEAESGKLIPNDPPSVTERAGAGPRHIAFQPDQSSQPYAYFINELDSTITAFSYTSEQGRLEPRQTISTLPGDFSGSNTCAEITVAPSGKFVYGSNRGHDSIVVYAVDQNNGQLSPVEWVSTQGSAPRFFSLDATGKLLYAANQNSHTIVAFEVDEINGKLTPTGQVIQIGSPVCIVFADKGKVNSNE